MGLRSFAWQNLARTAIRFRHITHIVASSVGRCLRVAVDPSLPLVRNVERELIPATQKFGLGMLPYFPLASGLLTGKYARNKPVPEDTRFHSLKGLADRYLTESNWKIVERLEKFCGKRDHTILELAFTWLLARPTVASVIAGATNPEQVEQNAKAAEVELTQEAVAEIDEITPKP